MEDILVYSAGVKKSNGEYTQFVESRDRSTVDDYIEIMKMTLPKEYEIVFKRADYRCVGVATHTVREADND